MHYISFIVIAFSVICRKQLVSMRFVNAKNRHRGRLVNLTRTCILPFHQNNGGQVVDTEFPANHGGRTVRSTWFYFITVHARVVRNIIFSITVPRIIIMVMHKFMKCTVRRRGWFVIGVGGGCSQGWSR